jgi:hypothetical protein
MDPSCTGCRQVQVHGLRSILSAGVVRLQLGYTKIMVPHFENCRDSWEQELFHTHTSYILLYTAFETKFSVMKNNFHYRDIQNGM